MRALVVVIVLLALAVPAKAQRGPEKVFAGKALTSDRPFPTKAKSAAAYVAAVRKNSKPNIMENEKTKTWEVFVAAFLKSPAKNLEVTVKIIDITEGEQAVISSFEQYLDGPGQRAVLTNFTLERDKVGVNRQLVLQIEEPGKILATGRFKILGKWEKHSGKVDFSSEDTK